MLNPEIPIHKAERNIRCNTSEEYCSDTLKASKQCRLDVLNLGLACPTETFNNPTVSDPLLLSGVEPQKAAMVAASLAVDRGVW